MWLSQFLGAKYIFVKVFLQYVLPSCFLFRNLKLSIGRLILNCFTEVYIPINLQSLVFTAILLILPFVCDFGSSSGIVVWFRAMSQQLGSIPLWRILDPSCAILLHQFWWEKA